MNQFKEVMYIIPAHQRDAVLLHNLLRGLICGLENIGFKVIRFGIDNTINIKAMLSFKTFVVTAIPMSSRKVPTNDFVLLDPCDPQGPLFFFFFFVGGGIDPVRPVEYVCNNWPKMNNQCFWFEAFKPDKAGQR
ncbi:hypothetical protein HPB48_017195 [Haemaphysalis longicornis]|uniref:Uncharacterized protein n=1 Tax=Haemaphysalis longicornis TaxID=44386 RepID=A0A9J6GX42_HAELO|nr:hypothetical protein HPB48_017195 [Haemaphysalis longicornis]